MEIELGPAANARPRARHEPRPRHRHLSSQLDPAVERPRSGVRPSSRSRPRPRSGGWLASGELARTLARRAHLLRRAARARGRGGRVARSARVDLVAECAAVAGAADARRARPGPAWLVELSGVLVRAGSRVRRARGRRQPCAASASAVGGWWLFASRRGRVFGGGAGEGVGEPVDGARGLGAVGRGVGFDVALGRVEACLAAGAGEGDVAPLLELPGRSGEHEGVVDGEPLRLVAGERVGVGDVPGVEVAGGQRERVGGRRARRRAARWSGSTATTVPRVPLVTPRRRSLRRQTTRSPPASSSRRSRWRRSRPSRPSRSSRARAAALSSATSARR